VLKNVELKARDKIGPLHDPILKPANLPDFLAVARRFLRFSLLPFLFNISRPIAGRTVTAIPALANSLTRLSLIPRIDASSLRLTSPLALDAIEPLRCVYEKGTRSIQLIA
jgi:hypothetical protein